MGKINLNPELRYRLFVSYVLLIERGPDLYTMYMYVYSQIIWRPIVHIIYICVCVCVCVMVSVRVCVLVVSNLIWSITNNSPLSIDCLVSGFKHTISKSVTLEAVLVNGTNKIYPDISLEILFLSCCCYKSMSWLYLQLDMYQRIVTLLGMTSELYATS